jgi:hypothetical protein
MTASLALAFLAYFVAGVALGGLLERRALRREALARLGVRG